MTERPTVAVVVVAYLSAAHLGPCLESMSAGCREHPLELVVVDNASPDDTRAVLGSRPDVSLVEMGRNAGFAAACNAGAATTAADFVCFVNPDARVLAGSIDALIAEAERRPEHLLYSGKVVGPDGRIDRGCCSALPSLWEYVCFASGLSTAFPRSMVRPGRPRSVGLCGRATCPGRVRCVSSCTEGGAGGMRRV